MQLIRLLVSSCVILLQQLMCVVGNKLNCLLLQDTGIDQQEVRMEEGRTLGRGRCRGAVRAARGNKVRQ
jgi:hypothetical protein